MVHFKLKNGELVMPQLQNLRFTIILTLTAEVASTISLVVFWRSPPPSFCYCYYFLSLFTVWQIKDDDDDDKIANVHTNPYSFTAYV